jgi:transcriptional regulator GlxA family with amidase domain
MARQRKQSSVREEARMRDFIAAAPHRVACLIFPGSGSFDVAAASEIFSTANGQLARDHGIARQAYTFEVIAPEPGPVTMEIGIKLVPDWTIESISPAQATKRIDTLLISGGCWDPVEAAVKNPRLIEWIKAVAPKIKRVVSFCTGAFIVAEAGLAKTMATTHWAHCDRFRARYPDLQVKADNIYIKEENIYWSAGGTSAMDLTLALVEEDLGRKLAMNVARRLVMFLKRPGGQSQFSTALLAQTASSDTLSDLLDWIADNLEEDLSVESLAGRAGMSPRNFARVFSSETGLTPAKFVERARLERARQLIEETHLSLLTIAERAGFESDQQLRRTFVRWLGVTPADYVARFRTQDRVHITSKLHIPVPLNYDTSQPWLP